MYNQNVQTDDDNLESSWEKLKEDYLDESACSICLENYVTCGEHQVAALKCGHIFGEICIKRWLSEAKSDGGPKCPTCKSKAKPNDIKLIVPQSIKKSDSSVIIEYSEKVSAAKTERIAAQSELENIKKQIDKMRVELSIQKKCYADELEELKRLEAIDAELLKSSVNATIDANNKAILQKSILQPLKAIKRLDLDGGSESRVCAVSDMLGLVMVAQKKGSSFGLTNIGASNFSTTEYISLHSLQIKDIAFHPFDGVILSASLDKTIKITDIFSSTPVMTFSLEVPVWSCCWNEIDTETFYVGLGNGTVNEYDRRFNLRPKSVLLPPPGTTPTPCASVNFVRSDQSTGVITTRLRNSTFFYKGRDSQFITQQLSATGRFMSSHYERNTAKLLYSSRPFENSHVTHSLWSLSFDTNGVVPLVNCVSEKCFYGGANAKQVTKSRLFVHPNKVNSCLVFAGDEDINGLIVWDTLTGETVQKLGGIGTAFDISQVHSQSNSYKSSFIVLTEKSLYLYDWTLN